MGDTDAASANTQNLTEIICSLESCCAAALESESLKRFGEGIAYRKKAEIFYQLACSYSENSCSDEKVEKLHRDNVYGIGSDLLRLNRYREALEYAQANCGSTAREQILLGVCCAHSVKNYPKAFLLLRAADSDGIEIDSWMLTAALYMLTFFYREAPHITGLKNGMQRAYQCVLRASEKSGEVGEWGNKELLKYSKNASGEYEYSDK